MSGYVSLCFTGCDLIDDLLTEIENAGDRHHHTERWQDDDDGPSCISRIDAAAKKSADKIAQLREALADVMVGGNHLACQLIDRLGPNFPDRYPPDMDPQEALRTLCATVEYDIWVCWASIMRARTAFEKTEVRAP